MLKFKLGRKPRRFNSRIMHLSSVFAAAPPPPPPISVDWTKGIEDWGMMLNGPDPNNPSFASQGIGDCTCAAFYHARQVWTANTSGEDTQPDTEVLDLYETVSGYNPDNPDTDQGADEQSVLSHLLNTGAPLANGATDKITAFFEVDPRNLDDIKTVINECGVCYIGFDVPDNIDETPGSTWMLDESASIEGGHAVVAVAYSSETVTVISWGSLYHMNWDFFSFYTDEAYAIIDPSWTVNGATPLGLTPEQLQSMMATIKK